MNWLIAKHAVAWIRGAWVKEPLPAEAMNPYYEPPPRNDAANKRRMQELLDGFHQRAGRKAT